MDDTDVKVSVFALQLKAKMEFGVNDFISGNALLQRRAMNDKAYIAMKSVSVLRSDSLSISQNSMGLPTATEKKSAVVDVLRQGRTDVDQRLREAITMLGEARADTTCI